ncbi:MAG: exosortase H [Archaeoglobaceae archaeon]
MAKRKKKDMKKELEEKKARRDVLKFVLSFIAISILLFSIYYLLKDTFLVSGLRNSTALISGTILSFLGFEVAVKGAVVSLDGFSMKIIDECTAIFSSIIYVSCVSAYPTTIKNKGLGVIAGVPLLYVIDMLRLLVLGAVGVNSPSLFEFFHVYFWQGTFIVFVIIVFLAWLRLIKDENK